MPIRAAIIGFGMAARVFHAPLLRAADELQLVAVSTSRRDAARPDVRVATADEILADSDIDLVVVATPNHTHFEIADAALRAGKHVVVDKPFTVAADEARQLIARARAAERLLTVFHNRRWDSDFLTVRDVLASRELGRVALFEAHWDRFRPQVPERWREADLPGAGLLYDLGPHLIDQALMLFGPPEFVSGDFESQREGAAVDDYFWLTLHYGRMRAVLSASSLAAQPRPRFLIHGTGGSFVKSGLDPQEDQLKAGTDPLAPGFGVEDESIHGLLAAANGSATPIPSRKGDYLSFYPAVAAAIRNGAPPPVPAEDALAAIAIIELARRSSAEGRRLPHDPGAIPRASGA